MMAQAVGGIALPVIGPVDIRGLGKLLANGQVALGVGVVALVVMLVLPMPPWLLDIMLAISITFSVLVLMTALLIRKPLEFSVFPAVLLLATLLRLALNISSTRLILSEGSGGTDAAGAIIEAFGGFVMQGNYVIGAIIFIILVIVNFVVITRGSGRIAEVAARFTLDAMPGKQMAIDADLSAGIITEDQARARRRELEGESNFFGAMDGASKFVRGDAVAGILITAINIVGGMIIGMAQNGLAVSEAASAYTVLTIGDGLVSQIPSLIISIAAGMLVSKAGVDGAADSALHVQLLSDPRALSIISGCALLTGLLPGMPLIPFVVLSVGSGYLAMRAARLSRVDSESQTRSGSEARDGSEPPISETLAMDELKIELGFGLLSFINETEGRRLADQIRAVRRQMALEYGFVAPPVRIVDDLELRSDHYRILVRDIEAGSGQLRATGLLAMNTSGQAAPFGGEAVKEPVFGLDALWIDQALREDASLAGYTVVDAATVLTTHFTEIIKEHMADLLTFGATRALIDELPAQQKALADDLIPSQMSVSGVQRILQMLVRERVSVRDLGAILEAIAEGAPTMASDPVALTEHVRSRLSRQLCSANSGAGGQLPVVTLSGQWERTFVEALKGEGSQRTLALEPERLQAFVAGLRSAIEAASQSGDIPVLLTSSAIRPHVRALVERFSRQTPVMSQNEVHPRARLAAAGSV